MARERTRFLCGECGEDHPRWEGRCSSCGAWNSLQAFHEAAGSQKSAPSVAGSLAVPVPLAQVELLEGQRLMVGISELDRVLGGGMVAGSAVLIGGDPGIGKSTLLLEAAAALGSRETVLYVSGEESALQLRLRSARLGLSGQGVWILIANSLEEVVAAVEKQRPRVVVVDSVQTLSSANLPAAAGTVSQVRECAQRLIQLAKRLNTVLFLVGHVTKEGQLAGPRVLEHMVDTVLYFEGERGHDYRILRAVKNRFGATDEIGVFAMGEQGLVEVPNPSEVFLAQRARGAAGSVVFAGVEGTRPVLVEIQSLVTPSPMAQPRRTTLGIENTRLAMLVAVLEKRLGLGLFTHDIFLNVAGGIRVAEPAADLAVAVSLHSAFRNRGIDPGLMVFGEVGLAGEIRGVAKAELRLKEAEKMGFTRCLLPSRSVKRLEARQGNMTVAGVATLEEALEYAQR
ncbi:MAG: DNA repair protein RadA [Magnetococcales bacterium]|nr:DNA repair protein RadA [Magnetococcales bacterium]